MRQKGRKTERQKDKNTERQKHRKTERQIQKSNVIHGGPSDLLDV